jgi:hypothetical protein
MKRPEFININEKAIEQCLLKIGKGRLEAACKLKELEFPKKKALFKIEWKTSRGFLSYAYSEYFGKKEYTEIMVLHNDELPETGWTIEWYRY